MEKRINILSLFANVGIAETYLDEMGFNVVLANEIDEKRVKFYKHLYPNVEVISGDITEEKVQDEVIKKALEYKVDMIMATPPCQGMSTAGKKEEFDDRNNLICCAVEIIKKIKPTYVFLENVPEQLITRISYKGNLVLIPEYVRSELGYDYDFADNNRIEAANHGIPQFRERAIMLLTKKTEKKIWQLPLPDKNVVTLEHAIGDLPILDPLIYDITYQEHLEIFPSYERRLYQAQEISKWHIPPKHVKRQVVAMMHTPSGKTAFDNIDKYKPHKADGTFVKGFKNTYKRQEWNKPAFTITMYNRTIGSQNNVHPGRCLGKNQFGMEIFSDPRVLTVYEIMKVMTLPTNWDIPQWASEHYVRSVIGEGIPPLLVKKIMGNICG